MREEKEVGSIKEGAMGSRDKGRKERRKDGGVKECVLCYLMSFIQINYSDVVTFTDIITDESSRLHADFLWMLIIIVSY